MLEQNSLSGLKDSQKKGREGGTSNTSVEMILLYKDYISSKNFTMPSNFSIDTK